MYLLDTCALLWWMMDAPDLGRSAKRVIESKRSAVAISVATLWEVAIKRRRGRLAGVDEYLARYRELHATWGFRTVVIEPEDAVAAGLWESPLTDPFDRMLVAQAKRLEARLVTCDEAITHHVKGCLW